MTPEGAMYGISLGRFGEWAESGRIAQNVMAVYLELDSELAKPDFMDILRRISELEGYTDDAEDTPGKDRSA